MYSDCLDLNRWYHGKSGCIAIIRLTKVLKYGCCEWLYGVMWSLCFHSNKLFAFVVSNRGELKRFLRTTPRITQHPLVVLTVTCQNSCHQYQLTPAPFLPLREHRWEELNDCVMVP